MSHGAVPRIRRREQKEEVRDETLDPELLRVPEPDRDVGWLEESLQRAVALEFATIPVYLAALWSIKDPPAPPSQGSNWPASVCMGAYGVLRGIAVEEMLHFGLVCNMLTTIGQPPEIISAVPAFPARGLPGGVRPDLWVSLAGLAKPRVHDLFMQIEYPEYPVDDDPPPPPPPEGDYATIGAFYDAITSAFRHAHPSIDGENQLTHATFDNFGCIGATVGGPETLPELTSQSDVLTAIETIKEQGEGTSAGPDAPRLPPRTRALLQVRLDLARSAVRPRSRVYRRADPVSRGRTDAGGA